MNVVVLRGTLSSDPVTRTLGSGSLLVTLEVSTPSAAGGVTSVPVVWFDPAAVPAWTAGTEVVVTGEVRRRFFRTAAGTQSRTEVVAAAVVAAARRRQVERVVDGARRQLGDPPAAALRSM